ncbi:DUF6274 family protein [Streptomyces cavernicola]|uniref:DUF6274 family protein n=1 Tax=Streptomyces cavernicola TaxID=3043613 RepID=A0ABT6S3D7_9ACTN|nr:DUF6274 family protein [Streptomyces sp. B-S-A6]MDI3402610.1 DUF6274 family protein [Streptomyces sp. B-S-A6]
MRASPRRHETRALLRAHLAAVSGNGSGYRHLTRHCPICHRLLRLAMEPPPRPLSERQKPLEAPQATEDESPASA